MVAFFHWGVNDLLLFMLQHGRPGNRPDKRHVSLGYSSLSFSPPHHLSLIRSPAAPRDMFCASAAFDITRKHFFSLWSVLNVGVFSPWARPPSINRYSSLPTTEPGGPRARTKHAFFFVSLMRNGRKRGRKNVWQKKKVEGFFKTATEDLFDSGRKESEGESRDILDVETNMCAWNHITPMLPLITSR